MTKGAGYSSSGRGGRMSGITSEKLLKTVTDAQGAFKMIRSIEGPKAAGQLLGRVGPAVKELKKRGVSVPVYQKPPPLVDKNWREKIGEKIRAKNAEAKAHAEKYAADMAKPLNKPTAKVSNPTEAAEKIAARKKKAAARYAEAKAALRPKPEVAKAVEKSALKTRSPAASVIKSAMPQNLKSSNGMKITTEEAALYQKAYSGTKSYFRGANYTDVKSANGNVITSINAAKRGDLKRFTQIRRKEAIARIGDSAAELEKERTAIKNASKTDVKKMVTGSAGNWSGPKELNHIYSTNTLNKMNEIYGSSTEFKTKAIAIQVTKERLKIATDNYSTKEKRIQTMKNQLNDPKFYSSEFTKYGHVEAKKTMANLTKPTKPAPVEKKTRAPNAELFKIENGKYTKRLNPAAAAKMDHYQLQKKIQELEKHQSKSPSDATKHDLWALRSYQLTSKTINPHVSLDHTKADRQALFNKAVKTRAETIDYHKANLAKRGKLDHEDTFALATLQKTKIDKKRYFLDTAGIKKAQAHSDKSAALKRKDNQSSAAARKFWGKVDKLKKETGLTFSQLDKEGMIPKGDINTYLKSQPGQGL